MSSSTQIACHCGAVKIQLSGEPVVDLYCHCRDCQRIAGGGCVPYSIYPHAAVEVSEGQTFRWALKDNPRTRCARCGTYLFGDPAGMGIHGISAYLLPEGRFKPAMHIMCKDALLPVQDALPHYRGFPAAFGGSDEQVDW
jgi:hypothetical protein